MDKFASRAASKQTTLLWLLVASGHSQLGWKACVQVLAGLVALPLVLENLASREAHLLEL